MSTGQTSSSLEASSASSRISPETSTSMKSPCSSWVSANLRSQPLLDRLRDLVDPLDDRDAGRLEAGDLLRGRVLGALDDRPRVSEGHSLHLLFVHELAGHEGDDREL